MEIVILINPILVLLVLIFIALKIYNAFMILVWQPFVLTRRFKKQGISGPKYRLLYGNLSEIKKMKRDSQLLVLDPSSNDVFPRVLPHYQQWMSLYGETFLYWSGAEPRICISDPELAKQILSDHPPKAANHPNALLAFSVGPRACIGQNFVMIEAKTVLTMILQRFRLSLSSEYKHAPMDNITIQPQYGLPVMLQPLED